MSDQPKAPKVDKMVRLELMSALTSFYFKHAPKYAGRAAQILRKYMGKEDFVWKSLYDKYGAVPNFDLGRINPAFVTNPKPWDAKSSADEAANAAAQPKKQSKPKRPAASRIIPSVDTSVRRTTPSPRNLGQTVGSRYSSDDSASISPTVRDAARRSALRSGSKSPSRSSNEGSSASRVSRVQTSATDDSESDTDSDGDGDGDDDNYDSARGVVQLTPAQRQAQEMARKLLNAAIHVPRAANAPWGVQRAGHESGHDVDSDESDSTISEDVSDDEDQQAIAPLASVNQRKSRNDTLARPESRSGRDTRQLRKV